MGVAAAVLQQHGIADVVQRRAVFPGGQRAKGRAGESVDAHAVSFRRNGEGRAASEPSQQSAQVRGHRRPDEACKPLKINRIRRKRKCDADHIIEINFPPLSPAIGSMRQMRLFGETLRLKDRLLRCRKLRAIRRHTPSNPLNLDGAHATNWRVLFGASGQTWELYRDEPWYCPHLPPHRHHCRCLRRPGVAGARRPCGAEHALARCRQGDRDRAYRIDRQHGFPRRPRHRQWSLPGRVRAARPAHQ